MKNGKKKWRYAVLAKFWSRSCDPVMFFASHKDRIFRKLVVPAPKSTLLATWHPLHNADGQENLLDALGKETLDKECWKAPIA